MELALGGNQNGTGNTIYDHGALVTTAQYVPGGSLVGVAHGEWWRLLTAAFLHYGPFHLLVNMYSLYFAGSLLEAMIGRWRFGLLYLASGLAGSAGALVVSPHSITVGASGAIFGILGALFVLERNRHIATGGQIAMLIVVNLIFSFTFSGISVGGHIGGLLGGVLLMWLMLQWRRSAQLSLASAVAVCAVSVLIAYWKARGYA
jgi:membrane associated rhomboid family serine protease